MTAFIGAFLGAAAGVIVVHYTGIQPLVKKLLERFDLLTPGE